MSRARPEEGEAGFALAEALVGFAILALVSLAMIRAFAGTTATLNAVDAREARLDLATRIVELTRGTDPLEPGRRRGEEDGLAWWSALEPVDGAGIAAPPGTPRLFRLSVGVGPKGLSTPPPPLLVTLVLARGADGG